jgi:hypothetical protein
VGPRAPADKVSQKQRREHREGGGNAPDEVAAARAHPSSGSTCGSRAEVARQCPTVAEALRSWAAPVAGSCNTGEDSNGETRPKLRGKGGGGWPSSPRMADGGGNGGVRRRPEPLGHRRWIGGIEGGAVEERTRHSGVDEGDGAKKGNIGGPMYFMVARWRGREEKGQGVPGFSTT